jgi:hypothetical protein
VARNELEIVFGSDRVFVVLSTRSDPVETAQSRSSVVVGRVQAFESEANMEEKRKERRGGNED